MAYDGPQIKLSGITAETDLRLFQYHFVKVSGDGIVAACDAADDIPVGVLQNTPNVGQAADIAVIGESKVAIEGTAATTTITDGDSSDVTAGKIVTLGAIVYTFRASVAVAYDVKVGGTADASLLNLARAINKSGGTAGAGQDYIATVANPAASASASVTSHVITLTARAAGTAGNSLVITTDESTLTIANTSAFAGGLGVSAGNTIGTGASGKADTKTVTTDAGEYVTGQIVEIAANVGELATAILNCASPHTAD